ncbi:ketoacyl-ACP synthase III [Flavobacteriaceae bacterium]|nr:ketoacyl-ACP synthase III [Flavobacteriaceae bacterium]MDA9886276.1 ketoacyl-ACP synthase III [Flavobacteriaceae bacterium]
MGSKITGTGSAMPSRVITNDYFLDHTFYTKEGKKNEKSTAAIIQKLEEISGIKERRFIPEDEPSVEILFQACSNAIQDAGIDKNEIDGLIVAHNAGNMLPNQVGVFHTVPNLAAVVKNKLGITNHQCHAYDILFGCPGWLQGVIQANRLIESGEATHVLVAGLEIASRLLDPNDVDSLLMADGCGATIVSKSESKDKGVLAHAMFSHTEEDLNNITLGASLNRETTGHCFFKMNGQRVYKYATTWLPQVIRQALDKVEITPSEVDYFFFHQANAKMLRVIASNLMDLYGITDQQYVDKIPSSISFLGNTSVATIPTLFDLVNKQQMEGFTLKEGQTYVFASVGAGMHCNAVVYKS